MRLASLRRAYRRLCPADLAPRLGALLIALVVGFAPIAAGAAPAGPIVVDVSVSGNAHVPTDQILSVVKTKVGDPFDEDTVRSDLQSIFDLGYFADQVPPLIRQRPGGIAITFRVIENPVIQQIVFRGNDHVPSDTLLALMDTSVGQVFNTNTFHEDVLKINSYYDKIGYGGQLPSHVANITINPQSGELDIDIREGLTVRHINITGDHVLPIPLIKSVLSLKEGQPYSEAVRDKDLDNVKKLYDKYDLTLGDFEAGIDPSSVDLTKGTADVNYAISVARVGAVMITGNTVTKDEVIRRQLRLRPGMIVTQAALRRDYDRLNNLGFFDKVELNPKPGPNPKKPAYITLDWNVKEQRTGTAGIGAGYSGGPTGTGLTGYVSYAQSNINGSGNGASVKVERGSRLSDASLSITIPYLGNTPRSQKYSLSGTIFTQQQTNYYQTYLSPLAGTAGQPSPVISSPGQAAAGSSATGGTIPVQLVPNDSPVSNILATYINRETGVTLNVGRRLNDIVTATAGVNVQRLATDVVAPLPYYVPGATTILTGQVSTPLGTEQASNSLGVTASSIANTTNGNGYNLHSLVFGLQVDTRDDVFNPRHGGTASLTEEVSLPSIGSDFNYTISTLDATRFYPMPKNSALGFHLQLGTTTGAIPVSKLFVYSDQQLRGYPQVFYGTEARLGQVELRIPLTSDRKFSLAIFGDYGSLRIRGAVPATTFGVVDPDYNNWLYHGDIGTGLRFDVPQLGFRSIRIDIAKGKGTTHTSFGIGQSF
ncbi:MAG TPA: POTRA domain-containing protein [Candidatus Acidoferrales bacterium]|nr:POTRA domain-containing protein [Candidatus Acidoferrales bacterium]